MNELDRLKQYPSTAKQRRFEWDFAKGAEDYEVWDEIEIGATGEGAQTFRIEEEDVLSFNIASLETDPAMVDADHARQNGGVVPHPLFVVPIAFYCIETGMGSWIRTPGASNPGQRIELFEQFKVGEEISARITHKDKWIRRRRYYLEDQWDFYNEHGTLKATWHLRLLVPRSRDEHSRRPSRKKSSIRRLWLTSTSTLCTRSQSGHHGHRCWALPSPWDFYNEHGTLKATWHLRLLVPRSRDEILGFLAL